MRMQVVWRKGAVRLVLVSAIAWALLVILALAFHLWSCNSDVPFLSGAPSSLPARFIHHPWKRQFHQFARCVSTN